MKNNKRQLKKDNTVAVVGVITAILMLGLVVSIFSIIQTVYVPQWMLELESDHMDEVAGQFAELKHTLDIQMYSPTYQKIPVTTPLTLGSQDIPYFLSQKSSGTMRLYDNNAQIDIIGDTMESCEIGTIEYASRNSYFIDQKFIYETGALIMYQSQGSLLLSKPFISISNQDSINLSMTVVDIASVGGKTSETGSNTCTLLTNYSSSQEYTIENTTEITIKTEYLRPWYDYINETFSDHQFTEGQDYTITQTDDEIIIDLQSMPGPVQVMLTKITMNVQIAPGWVS